MRGLVSLDDLYEALDAIWYERVTLLAALVLLASVLTLASLA